MIREMKRRGTPNTKTGDTNAEVLQEDFMRTKFGYVQITKVALAIFSSAPETHDQRHQTKRRMKPPAASVVPGGQTSGSFKSSHHHNSKKSAFLQGHPTVCPVGGQHLLERGSRKTRSFFSKRITLHCMIFYGWVLDHTAVHLTCRIFSTKKQLLRCQSCHTLMSTQVDAGYTRTGSKRMTEGLQVS